MTASGDPAGGHPVDRFLGHPGRGGRGGHDVEPDVAQLAFEAAAPTASTRRIDGSWSRRWRAVARDEEMTRSGETGAPIALSRVT